jgi:omega-amidase
LKIANQTPKIEKPIMHVHAVQLDLVWHDRSANHASARRAIETLAPRPGDLVVLPEMFPVGFTMDVAQVRDGADDTDAFLSDVARSFKIYLIAGNVRQPDDLGRNEAAAYAPDGTCLVRYHKMHPFSFADEHLHYRAGNSIQLFTAGNIKIAPFICYDLRFPEIFRAAVRQGAQVMVVIANWPIMRVAHWLALLSARAIENQCYVIGCNRVGRDPNVVYPGRSQIIDPQGNIIADAGDSPGVISSELNLDALSAYRKSFPALSDMRMTSFE